MSGTGNDEEQIPENKFRKEKDAINNSPKWTSSDDPDLITGSNCFDLNCNFSDLVVNQPKNLITILSTFVRLIPPTYNASYGLSSQIEEYEMIHKPYFPVITSVKHVRRTGP